MWFKIYKIERINFLSHCWKSISLKFLTNPRNPQVVLNSSTFLWILKYIRVNIGSNVFTVSIVIAEFRQFLIHIDDVRPWHSIASLPYFSENLACFIHSLYLWIKNLPKLKCVSIHKMFIGVYMYLSVISCVIYAWI